MTGEARTRTHPGLPRTCTYPALSRSRIPSRNCRSCRIPNRNYNERRRGLVYLHPLILLLLLRLLPPSSDSCSPSSNYSSFSSSFSSSTSSSSSSSSSSSCASASFFSLYSGAQASRVVRARYDGAESHRRQPSPRLPAAGGRECSSEIGAEGLWVGEALRSLGGCSTPKCW